METQGTNPLAQSTLVIKSLLEVLPVDKILEFRVVALKLHQQQLNLIDEILAKKGYGGPLEGNQ